MRLLLVEDDVRIHTFPSRALIEAGYQVDVASDGKTGEAIHIYRLRSKVDHDAAHPLIHTIRGVGYVLKHA